MKSAVKKIRFSTQSSCCAKITTKEVATKRLKNNSKVGNGDI